MSHSTAPRRLILLGSTGSIGENTMQVIAHLHARGLMRFELVGLAAGSNAAALRDQAERFGVKHIALADAQRAAELDGMSGVRIWTGEEAAMELVRTAARPGDLVVGAMVGSAGIPATLAAIECGCDVALANKETLVAAGAIVMPLVRQKQITLLPIDSEHSAIYQCLLAGRSIDEVRRLVITASGGPFRTWTKQQITGATVADALNHPTWNMGRKVTIDSASMMNKALEVIEAHWLFGLAGDQIDVIVHPQSLVHSFVEFVDGSVMAQLGPPDMRTPIQYALTWPHRQTGCSRTMEWSKLRDMHFEPVDHDRFGALRLAYDVVQRGGTTGAVLNAANEEAVSGFLAGRISFDQITDLTSQAMQNIPTQTVASLADVLEADEAARTWMAEQLSSSRAADGVRSEPSAAAQRLM